MNTYEITFQKYKIAKDERGAVRTCQIRGMTEWDACATLGQVLHDLDFDLKILEVKKVKD